MSARSSDGDCLNEDLMREPYELGPNEGAF